MPHEGWPWLEVRVSAAHLSFFRLGSRAEDPSARVRRRRCSRRCAAMRPKPLSAFCADATRPSGPQGALIDHDEHFFFVAMPWRNYFRQVGAQRFTVVRQHPCPGRCWRKNWIWLVPVYRAGSPETLGISKTIVTCARQKLPDLSASVSACRAIGGNILGSARQPHAILRTGGPFSPGAGARRTADAHLPIENRGSAPPAIHSLLCPSSTAGARKVFSRVHNREPPRTGVGRRANTGTPAGRRRAFQPGIADVRSAG